MKSAKEWQEVWPGDVHAAEKLTTIIVTVRPTTQEKSHAAPGYYRTWLPF